METGPKTREEFDAGTVATIRDVAEIYPGVGTNCMSIWIYPSAPINVVIRYDHGPGLRAHRQTQNALANLLAANQIEALSPTATDPDWDIAWRTDKASTPST